jgi:Integrase core domain
MLKCLTVVDEYTRECLAIDVGGSIRSQRVIEVLSKLVSLRGSPRYLRSDNGPEFVSRAILRNTRHSRSAASLANRRAACAEARRSSVHLLVLCRAVGGFGVKLYAPVRWIIGDRDAAKARRLRITGLDPRGRGP